MTFGLQQVHEATLGYPSIKCLSRLSIQSLSRLYDNLAVTICNCNKLFSSQFDIQIKEHKKWSCVINCS